MELGSLLSQYDIIMPHSGHISPQLHIDLHISKCLHC